MRTHPSRTSRITQSCAVLLGMPAAFWISATVKKPASCVNWRIRRRYSRRCSSTLAIVVADVQDIADDGACRLYRSCTFANQRDLLCHIGLEGERIQRSFDYQRVALLDEAGGDPEDLFSRDRFCNQPDGTVSLLGKAQCIRGEQIDAGQVDIGQLRTAAPDGVCENHQLDR